MVFSQREDRGDAGVGPRDAGTILADRYDRVDNFWFCLLHELAHVGRHTDTNGEAAFVDDLSLRGVEGTREDPAEIQVDEWAEEALIPRAIWETSAVRRQATLMAVISLANALQIHPAIVAGRVRHEDLAVSTHQLDRDSHKAVQHRRIRHERATLVNNAG